MVGDIVPFHPVNGVVPEKDVAARIARQLEVKLRVAQHAGDVRHNGPDRAQRHEERQEDKEGRRRAAPQRIDQHPDNKRNQRTQDDLVHGLPPGTGGGVIHERSSCTRRNAARAPSLSPSMSRFLPISSQSR